MSPHGNSARKGPNHKSRKHHHEEDRIAFCLPAGDGLFRAGRRPGRPCGEVAKTKGLVAFWDFSLMQDGRWASYHDENVVRRAFPVSLRRIGDPKSYTPGDWPYTDEKSKLMFDASGPFGHAVRFNQGYIFAEVARSEFDKSPLDIHGRQPFTLSAWTKFVGQRHLVAGIWDEGGWDKYGGRRQIALFGGLFGCLGPGLRAGRAWHTTVPRRCGGLQSSAGRQRTARAEFFGPLIGLKCLLNHHQMASGPCSSRCARCC